MSTQRRALGAALKICYNAWVSSETLTEVPVQPARTAAPDLPLALFLLSALIGLLPAYDRGLAWLPLAYLLGGGVVYALVSRVGARGSNVLRIAIVISALGALAAVYIILQLPHTPADDKIGVISRLLEGLARVIPDFGLPKILPNSAATLLEGLIFLALGAGMALRGRATSAARLALFACAAIMAAAVFLTVSRGAWLALALAGLAWAAAYFRPARWLGLALVALALALLLVVIVSQDVFILQRIPLVDKTIAPLFLRPDRLDVYRGSLQLIGDVPLSGVGLGKQFAMNYSRYVLIIQVPYLEYSHNLYLEAWLQQGILGLAALLWLLATIIFSAVRGLQRGHATLFEGAWVGLVAMFLHGLTDARPYSDWWTWLPFFVLCGILSAELLREHVTSGWRASLLPLAVTAVVLLAVSTTLPALPAAWRTNLGAIQQAKADLGVTLRDDQRAALRAQAEANFQRAAALAPGERAANLRLGWMLAEDEDFNAAVRYLEAAYTAAPGSPTVIKALGLGYVWNGQVDRAAQMLAALPGMAQELNNWAFWRMSQGKALLARRAYQTSLLIQPDQPEVQRALDALQP